MIIKNLTNSSRVPFDLDAFILHSEEKIEIVHLVLKPGEKLEKHTNPFDVIFFVIEGKGVLDVENEKIQLNATDTLKISSEKNRSWENTYTNDLRILVIKLL